ncbi:MAG: fasciclin domain-containing protein, partial [Prevotellaceae bacterium]|nr:fasciclin domain-containing protein [Prevotellaceae bacterium]
MKRIGYILLFTLCIGLFSCQESEWDSYYKEQGNGVTLLEQINQNPQLSKFSAAIHRNGLDELLASSQTLTVFAPDDNAMGGYVEGDEEKSKFVMNHICRYVYSQGDIEKLPEENRPLRMKMLNGKYQNLESNSGKLQFAGIASVMNTQNVKNGVLNIIDTRVPFFNNIYEEIKQKNATDSIANYLQKMDEYTFQPQKSTVIGTNDVGETVYDSVFYFQNKWMNAFGDIHLEDSVYSMIVPSNKAWTNHYNKVKPYFRTFGEGSTTISGIQVKGTFNIADETSDSLCDAHTKETITHDLVFRHQQNVDSPAGDSLVSSSGNIFYNPRQLFAGTEERGVSNGRFFFTDSLNHSPQESWHKEIRVEAENSQNYAQQYCSSTYSSSVLNYPQFAGKISENSFLIANPSALSFQKNTVRFQIPNTLAGAYNIYIVTVPASAVDTTLIAKPEELRSTKVQFYLTYVHEDGKLSRDAVISTPSDYNGTQTPTPIDSSKPAFITDAVNVNKMLVAKNFKFPYANFTSSPFNTADFQDIVAAYLQVECNVTSAADLNKYEKVMR